ncbi:hypothetical protein [Aromatoleum sp.]|uniref:hypothetical protein n=1 Tax=Aromatoleum sp. TaxID=2307007 RepID=UPI0039C8B568
MLQEPPHSDNRTRPSLHVGLVRCETEILIGRSCIDAEYRSGAVMALLRSGLARYIQEDGYGYRIGCASISMTTADAGRESVQSAQGNPFGTARVPRFPPQPLAGGPTACRRRRHNAAADQGLSACWRVDLRRRGGGSRLQYR